MCDRCGSINEAIPVEGRVGYWRCRACGKQFSVTAGTPMHDTHVPLHVWSLGMYLILTSSKGISAVKLGEQLGVQYRTAWHLAHRIRAMLASGDKPYLSGIVEADETYVGGKAANLHTGAERPEKRGRGTKKPMLFAAVKRGIARCLLCRAGRLRVRGVVLPDGADLKQVAVTQEPNGWHVSIQFEAAPKVYATPTRSEVGIDSGLAHLLTLSDGERVAHPRIAKKAHKRIRRLNRERDRRQKGSVNRRRTVARLGRVHRRVADMRRDHIHKLTRELVDTYAGFAVEDLSLRGMMRTRMASSLADAGLGEAIRTLRYKATWAGRTWRVHARFRRSTGVCPETGQIGPKVPLSVREWTCDCCGIRHDRDVAAARVILAGARSAQADPVGQALPEPAGGPQRKRSSAVCGRARASVRASHGGSLPNVATVASRD